MSFSVLYRIKNSPTFFESKTIESFEQSPVRFYTTEPNNISFGARKLRYLVGIIYAIGVTFIVAPIGMSRNLVEALEIKLILMDVNDRGYQFYYQMYKSACWADFKCFAFAVTMLYITKKFIPFLIASAISNMPLYRGLSVGIIAMLVQAIALTFKTTDYSDLVRYLVSRDTLEAGLDMALRFRDELGFVDETGHVLPYSTLDTIKLNRQTLDFDTTPHRLNLVNADNTLMRDAEGNLVYAEEEAAFIKFSREIGIADGTLLDRARETKFFLEKKGIELPYQYPFIGRDVANFLNEHYHGTASNPDTALIISGQAQADEEVYVESLKRRLCAQDQKAAALRAIFNAIRADVVRQRAPDLIPSVMQACLLSEEQYKTLFDTPYVEARKPEFSFEKYSSFTALDPSTEPLADGVILSHYDQFLRNLRVAKHEYDQTKKIDFFKLLNLPENFTDEEFQRAIDTRRGPYAKALHPDKNSERIEEAGILFQAFQDIAKDACAAREIKSE